MLPEKPDDSLPWRHRLEQLESLPGEHLTDKTQLWEKLHNRLPQAPRQPITRWYWLAAACLLFVFMLPLIRVNTKQPPLVRSKPVQTRQTTGKPDHPVVIYKTPSVPREVATKPVAKAHPQIKKPKHILHPADPGSTERIEPGELTALPVTPGFIAPLNRDTMLMASFQPQPKKLRVVHINELEQPLRENIHNGPKHSTAVFQKQRARQFPGSGFEFGSNTSEEILKIKLSPSN